MAVGDILANPLTGFIRVDERDANITYNPAGVQGTNSNFNASTYTTVNSGYIRFNFTGSSIKLIGGAIPTNFTFTVYIDSETTGKTYTCPANSGAKVLFFEIDGLSDSEHSIIIKDFISFRMDAVDILTGKTLMPYRITIHNKILLSSGDKYISVKKGMLVDSNVIPVHSSNTSPNGGLVNTNNTVPSTAYTLFDGNSSNNLTFSLMTNVWVSYEFPSPKAIGKYTLIVTGASSINRAPREWKFEGSNDGVIWTQLDYQNEPSNNWTMGVKRSFSITNTIKFKFYRVFIVISNNGSSTAPSLSEIEMMEMSSNELYELDNFNEITVSNYGSDTPIKLTETFTRAKDITKENTQLGSGKTFEHTIDMSKRQVDKITLG